MPEGTYITVQLVWYPGPRVLLGVLCTAWSVVRVWAGADDGRDAATGSLSLARAGARSRQTSWVPRPRLPSTLAPFTAHIPHLILSSQDLRPGPHNKHNTGHSTLCRINQKKRPKVPNPILQLLIIKMKGSSCPNITKEWSSNFIVYLRLNISLQSQGIKPYRLQI